MIAARSCFASALALLALVIAAAAAPSVQTLNPAAGATVNSLSSIAVTFNEPVSGVDADDLWINGQNARAVVGSGAGPYTFSFSQPAPGTVDIAWDLDHGISGLGTGGFVAPAPWTYTLVDTQAPVVTSLTPANGATVGILAEVEVIFGEAVVGVDAADLLINSVPAETVSGSGAGPYRFSFPQPAAGVVNFTWTTGHAVRDTAATPNAFAGGGWSVTLSASGAGSLVINEFLAANAAGLTDENGDQEDWIEIHNPGPAAVNLVGWALTDEATQLARWVFPSRTLNAGAYLVVFASGKNRRPANGNLHTSFKLSDDSGYLALIKPELPRTPASVISAYPPQRPDFSYGVAAGQLRYFSPPTPNAPNTSQALTALAAKPDASVTRGFFKDPFQLVLTAPSTGTTVRYTTNGAVPTATTGTAYTGPLTISGTTVLRAAAFGSGYVPSETVTHSYIFLDQVLTQSATPAGFPTNWGAHSGFTGGVVPADYGMDPEIVNDPQYTQMLKDGLRELPILSVVLPVADMFSTSGLYFTPNVTNKSYPDKKCSVEMLLPDGSTAFATTCGINGHGNASRDPLKNPKHGFKLKFKGEYGASKLKYRLFPETAVDEFEDIILRPDFNSSWRHWSDDSGNANGAFQRTRATRTRDAWVKDSMRALGGAASHNRFTHLFINGLYWGTYDLSEQPKNQFVESYLGASSTGLYDIIDQPFDASSGVPDNTPNENNAAYAQLLGVSNLAQNSAYEQMKGILDVRSFIDYTLLHFYVGHQDWGNEKNWYAVRRREPGARFHYIPWDGECVLLNVDVNRVVTAPSGSGDVPSALQTRLDDNAQYRLDFADRVHRAMIAPGGGLTPSANISRWQKWQAVMDKPIVAESARWGDYRRDVHQYQTGTYPLYTRNTHWVAENTRMVNSYFPTANRHTTVMNQLRAAGLYPTVGAPEIRTFISGGTSGVALGSGAANAGTQVELVVPAGTTGTIQYTLDGSDPRVLYAGTVSPSAQAYTLDTPITLNGTTTIRARVLNGTTWSALNEATFTVGVPARALAISEIMYNPPGGAAHEFIELHNYGALPIELDRYSLSGIEFVFPLGTTLPAGARLVLASNDNPTSFAAQYPGVTVAGHFGGALDNSGERLAVLDPQGRIIFAVTYSDAYPWPKTPDGGGSSLEIVNPAGDPDDAFNWKASNTPKGTAGLANSPRAATTLVISEVMTNNVSGVSNAGLFSDYVELHNTSASSVSVGGLVLELGAANYTFPAGTAIPAGAYLTVWLDSAAGGSGLHSGTAGLPTSLGAVRLTSAARDPAAIIDAVSYGYQVENFSVGRVNGKWQLTQPSPGSDNTAAALAPAASNLVLNEWLANPEPGRDDWLELHNKHASLPVALTDLFFQTNTQLDRYSALSFVPPGGFLQIFANQQAGAHALGFNLAAEGTTLSILELAGLPVDSVTFAAQASGVSQGRLPDGAAPPFASFDFPTPGAPNVAVIYDGPRLNELMARNVSSASSDWVELHHAGAAAFDLSGMRLGHLPQFAQAWPIPAGTIVPAGGYLVIRCDITQPASTTTETEMNSRAWLTDDKGALYLFNAAGQIVDSIRYGFQIADAAIGRTGGEWKLLASPTRGAANAAPAVLGSAAGVRINEWFRAGSPDWFELFNPGTSAVELTGLFISDDPAEPEISKFQVSPLNFIGAGGWVRFWCEGVVPFGGNQVSFDLDSAGEYLRLSAPNLAQIDAVSFGPQNDSSSQGRVPDGETVQSGLTPTPGARNILSGAPSIDVQPASQTVATGANVTFTVSAVGASPLTFQWQFNGADLTGANSPTFSLSNVTMANDGRYTVVVTNSGGSTTSEVATLAVQRSFADWAASFGLTGANAAAGADGDHDGLTNLQEYFHNLSPSVGTSAADRLATPQIGVEPSTGTPQFLTLTYRRSARAAAISASLQSSTAPAAGSWTTIIPNLTEQLGPDPVTGDPRVRLKVAIQPGETKKFLRLLLTE